MIGKICKIMTVLNPYYILLLSAVPIILWLRTRRKIGSLRFGSVALFSGIRPGWKVSFSRHLWLMRFFSCVLIIFGLMRFQSPIEESRIETEGVDIILAVDASGSMAAEDFVLNAQRYNRLEAVKRVMQDFIRVRQSDRLGIIAFAGRAYTVCPLTLDHAWLIDNIERIELGVIEEDGTAIGSAIASALNRFRDSQAKSRILILLTDGRNNAGAVDPLKAAEAAKTLGIKIYTIGAGSRGFAPYPAQDFFGNTVYRQIQADIDEDTLMKIAEQTDGEYFRATDMKSLKNIYAKIDELETTSIEEQGYAQYNEQFPLFIWPAVILLVLEFIAGNTVFRRLP